MNCKIIKEKNGEGEVRYKVENIPIVSYILMGLTIFIVGGSVAVGVFDYDRFGEIAQSIVYSGFIMVIFIFISLCIESKRGEFDNREDAEYFLEHGYDKSNHWIPQ